MGSDAGTTQTTDQSNADQPTPTTKGDEGKLWTVKADKKEHQLTTEELLQAASKGIGADAAFREAAELRKAAGESMRMRDLMTKVKDDNDLGAMRELLMLWSYTGAQADEFIQNARSGNMFGGNPPIQQPQPQPQPAGDMEGIPLTTQERAELEQILSSVEDGTQTPQQMVNVGMSQLSPDLQEKLNRLDQRQDQLWSHTLQDERGRAHTEIDNAVDSDAVLSTLMIGNTARRQEMHRQARRLVTDMVRGGEQFGNDVVNKALQQLRAMAQNFGVGPSQSGVQPNQDGGLSTLGGGIGPSGGRLPTIRNVGGPPSRVPVGDPKRDQNLLDRLNHHILAARQAEQTL